MTKIIVFSGIDGSGKSTQAKKIVKYFNNNGTKTTYLWCRWSPFLLNPLKKIYKKRHGLTNTINYNEKKDIKNKFFGNKNKFVYKYLSLIEFFLQSWLKILPRMFANDILIIDRFYIDFLIDQALNYNESKEQMIITKSKFKKIFAPVVINFIFDISEETAIKRGKEGDIDYIKDLRKKFKVFLDEPDCVLIDANRSEKEVFNDIKSIINSRI